MTESAYDVAIVGGGSGGYIAAVRAAEAGLRTILIERQQLGGMCLNWGCMPTKALLEAGARLELIQEAATFGVVGIDPRAARLDWAAAMVHTRQVVQRLRRGVEELVARSGVEVLNGHATLLGPGRLGVRSADGTRRELEAAHTIVATGSRFVGDGVEPFAERVLEVRELFDLPVLPKAAAVWGGNARAVELALILALFGVKTTLVASEARLIANLDGDLSLFAQKRLWNAGVKLFLGRHPAAATASGITLDDGTAIEAEWVLNANRRAGALEVLGDAPARLQGDFLAVDAALRTSLPNVFAVGDVTGEPMLAHVASVQGELAVAIITGSEQGFDLRRVPWNIYLQPELASVGASEEQLQARGTPYNKSVFMLASNGKAIITGRTDGFVKVLSDEGYGEILGVHIAAPHATEMIGEAVVAMRFGLTATEIASSLHPHPTLSEVIREANLHVGGERRAQAD